MTTAYATPASFTDVFLAKIGVALPTTWDPAIPVLNHVIARIWAYSTATRGRRFLLLPLVIWAGLFCLALLFPAEAHAAITMQSPLVAAYGLRDSYGDDPANYMFSTNYGSVFDGGSNMVLAIMLQIESGIFVFVGTTAVWLICYALSFGFLPSLIRPMAVIIQDYARQILPGVASISGTIVALIVAINLMRGKTSQAMSQTVAALIVAMIAGAFAYSPITWAISDSGPIITGRDIAIAAAANTPSSGANTENTLKTLQGNLLTNYVRHPLQGWNLGAIVDDNPACQKAYSEATRSRNADGIKDGIARCGAANSADMKASADNPNTGQVVTGFGLLFATSVLLIYAIVTVVQVFLEFIRATASSAKMVWGMAVGRIPGGPQRSMVSATVEVFYSGFVMFGFVTITIVVGTFVTAVFRAQGNPMLSMMECLLIYVAAIIYIIKFARSRERASDAIASSILDAVGDPGPIESASNIASSRSTSHLPSLTSLAIGVGAGVGASYMGEALTRHYPTAGEALRRIAPFHNNPLLRNVTRGTQFAHQKQTTTQLGSLTQQMAEQRQQSAQTGQQLQDIRQHMGIADPPTGPAPAGMSWLGNGGDSGGGAGSSPTGQTSSTSTKPGAPGAALPPSALPDVPLSGVPASDPSTPVDSGINTPPPPSRNTPTLGTPMPADALRTPDSPSYSPRPEALYGTGQYPTSVDEHRQRFPHLCGAETTTKGKYCINSATSCPHHTGTSAGWSHSPSSPDAPWRRAGFELLPDPAVPGTLMFTRVDDGDESTQAPPSPFNKPTQAPPPPPLPGRHQRPTDPSENP